MADWFVEVATADLVEVFEFIDYRKAVAFGFERLECGDALAVELIDVDGRVLFAFSDDPWGGAHGFSTTPRRAGLYRWDPRSEQLRQVSL